MRHIWWANRFVTGAVAIVLTMVAYSDGQGLPPKTLGGKPDLSGIWRSTQDRYRRNLAADFPRLILQPSAAAVFKQRSESAGKANPAARCLPRGLPGAMLVREYPWKLVQTPASVLILFDEALDFRQIHFDGRSLPEDPQPTWMGYSVGRWEGDTLVSETIGVSEDTWLDDLGHPHSDAMRVLERFRRRTIGMMDVEITIQDAKAYSRPWGAIAHFELLPKTDLDEHICPVQGKP
jgi:hypothetical protein